VANRRKSLRSDDPEFLRDAAAHFRELMERLRQPELKGTLGQLAEVLEARAHRLTRNGAEPPPATPRANPPLPPQSLPPLPQG
jgi:hypothetical protein